MFMNLRAQESVLVFQNNSAHTDSKTHRICPKRTVIGHTHARVLITSLTLQLAVVALAVCAVRYGVCRRREQ